MFWRRVGGAGAGASEAADEWIERGLAVRHLHLDLPEARRHAPPIPHRNLVINDLGEAHA